MKVLTMPQGVTPEAEEMNDPKECEWAQDCYGNYDTDCLECFTFLEGGPGDNKARFCCFCGGRIVVKTYTEEEE